MSHFVVYVFGDDVDDLLAPYSENLEVAPYIRYTKQQAIAEMRKEIEDYKNDTYAKFLEDPDWWGIVTNEKDQDKYTAEFKKFISKLPKDTTVTVVDCHI